MNSSLCNSTSIFYQKYIVKPMNVEVIMAVGESKSAMGSVVFTGINFSGVCRPNW